MPESQQDPTPDYGHVIGFHVLQKGTPVYSSDGIQIGTVRDTSNDDASHIFDGIKIDTDSGKRFLDAPEVEAIYERGVVATFTAAEREQLLQQ